MRFLAGLVVVALAGCSTVQSVSDSEVDASQVSAKSIDEVSRCLQLRYDTPERVEPNGTRAIIAKNNYGGVIALFTLHPVANGTRIDLQTTSSLNMLGSWRDCA